MYCQNSLDILSMYKIIYQSSRREPVRDLFLAYFLWTISDALSDTNLLNVDG